MGVFTPLTPGPTGRTIALYNRRARREAAYLNPGFERASGASRIHVLLAAMQPVLQRPFHGTARRILVSHFTQVFEEVAYGKSLSIGERLVPSVLLPPWVLARRLREGKHRCVR
jgi:hypothetical protein